MLKRYRKLKGGVGVGALMTLVRIVWPDLVLPESFNETLVGVATAIAFFVTRESSVGITNLRPK